MKIDPGNYQVKEGKDVDLKKWSTRIKPLYSSKEEYEKVLAEHVEELSAIQSHLYADDRYSVLLIFQAMDAAGKEGKVKYLEIVKEVTTEPDYDKALAAAKADV
jgi:polyphosphate kinase 2 (PPK2 family)